MDDKKFAELLVEKIALPKKDDVRLFHSRNGLESSRLGEADEIWKLFVRYNLDTGGMKSSVVESQWNQIENESILKSKNKLLEGIAELKGKPCYENFTLLCPMTFKNSTGFIMNGCAVSKCPLMALTETVSWHRKHYKIAKIIAECAKRLLVENRDVHSENLNDLIIFIFDKYRGKQDDWRHQATSEFISLFDNIKEYGTPRPKVIVWMLSDLGSPFHQINHWPDIDLTQLTPVDTHVKRLVERFGWVVIPTDENIRRKLAELYPEEPRKLDFALFRLGAESEENICSKTPKCGECHARLRVIYDACSANDKKRV